MRVIRHHVRKCAVGVIETMATPFPNPKKNAILVIKACNEMDFLPQKLTDDS
jgi:hypothetical protein